MINVCANCYNDEPPTEKHVAEMLEGEAALRALIIIHGPERGIERYCGIGGLIHGPSEWLREEFGNDLTVKAD